MLLTILVEEGAAVQGSFFQDIENCLPVILCTVLYEVSCCTLAKTVNASHAVVVVSDNSWLPNSYLHIVAIWFHLPGNLNIISGTVSCADHCHNPAVPWPLSLHSAYCPVRCFAHTRLCSSGTEAR